MTTVLTGLDQLDSINESDFKGNIGLLCHSASVDRHLDHAIEIFINKFASKLTKIFAPQHGLVSDVQDNMIESDHYTHPYYQLPVYSLYSETRRPSKSMLKNIDHIFIDLQDVGCRIYTYIYTMAHMMEECAKCGINVYVIDRPNPIGGEIMEGNILDPNFQSFVGLYPIPVRHGMTIGEIALLFNAKFQASCNLKIIKMKNWKRSFYFEQTNLPWVLPSPNLATPEAAVSFVGTVLFEGCNVSEGRGTARALEIIGHPEINPHDFLKKHEKDLLKFKGVKLRPIYFIPTFNKHAGKSCGGFQLHITEPSEFRSWKLCQFLMKEFFHELNFSWKKPPYEYEYEKLPIDMINGTDLIRNWIEKNGSLSFLDELENKLSDFQELRKEFLLY
jgi:uncharacterized protein YbbC (DUF1343 family)